MSRALPLCVEYCDYEQRAAIIRKALLLLRYRYDDEYCCDSVALATTH